MNLPPLGAASASMLPPAEPGRKELESHGLAESCRQFEAILWRQVVDKAMTPMLSQSEGAQGADKTGVYNYFVSDHLAQAVAGAPRSFAQILEQQLTPRARGNHTP